MSPARTMELYHRKYGAGPPLLILHGLLGASGNWHTLSSKVFGTRFEVYALDLRNHGRSPHSDVFDYPAMAGDVVAFMDRHGLAHAHLLGHSMGGKVAMHVALAYPERVDRLVVVDIAPRAYPPHHTALLEALAGVDLAAVTGRQQVDDALAARIPSVAERQFLLKNLAYDSATGRFSWQMNLEGIARNYDRVNTGIGPGPSFVKPALFVRGSASRYVTDEDAGLIRQLFPNARIITIASGHWIHAEAPEPFGRAVMDFLTEA
jgi:esterase